MIEEGEDQLGREVSQRDGRRRLRTVRLDEIEEQDERIPVGSHGAGAQGPLLGKVLGKECLDQGWEGRYGGGWGELTHGRLPALRRSARSACRPNSPFRARRANTSRGWRSWYARDRWTARAWLDRDRCPGGARAAGV